MFLKAYFSTDLQYLISYVNSLHEQVLYVKAAGLAGGKGAIRTENKKQARQAIENTMCLNLLDFYTRRVPFILSRKDHGLSELDLVAKVFQREFSLSVQEISSQKKQLTDYLEKEFRWRERLGR